MDSDFVNNLSNMFNNGNIPDEVKSMLNNFKSDSENAHNINNSNNSNNESDSSQPSNEATSSSINPEMLKNIMNMFNNSNNGNSNDSNNVNNSNSSPNIDINTLLKMKSIMDKMNTNKNDPRSNLLLSLKPYLKESRKNKVEQYVQLFNMTKIIDAFNQNGGESAK